MTATYIIHLANYSDGVLYILAFLMLVTLSVMIDRFWFLRRTIAGGDRVVRQATEAQTLGLPGLRTLASTARRLPESVLLDAAMRHAEGHRGAPLPDRLDEAIMLVAPTLDRRLWILDTAVTLAPLLGLFGTIIGMFHAFSVLAAPGHAPADVTAGVADALVATACGLLIAMVGLAGFNALSNQVRFVIHQLDTLRTLIVNRTPLATDVREPAARLVEA